MRVAIATAIAIIFVSMLDRASSLIVASKSHAMMWRAAAGAAQPSRVRGFLRMGEGRLGLSTASAPVEDTLRPRPLLRDCIQAAPSEPGVYIMESAEGRKLYIGKSVKLSSRVPSYFSSISKSSGGSEGSGERGRGVGPAAVAEAVVLPGANLSRRIAVMTTLVER